MKLYNDMNEEDCMALDGGYTLFIKQLENFCKEKNYKISDDNFFYPIRKEPGINLNKQEEHYNKVFGSFRSIIENQFSELHHKYKRFSNNNSMLKSDDIKYVNLQLKVSFLLKNIQKFSEKFNIIIQEHHKLWINENFEFPNEARLIDIVYTNEMDQLNKLKRLNDLQTRLLNLDINEINKNKNHNNEMMIDENNTNNEYMK